MTKNQKMSFVVLALASVLTFFGVTYTESTLDFLPQTDFKRVVDFPSVKKGNLLFSDVDGSEWVLHDIYQQRENVSFNKSKIHFKNLKLTNDDWNYISIDPQKNSWRDYTWEFDIKRMTKFREFAFNFRNLDFDNRYRYRFEDDKLFFDKKVKGQWINNISSINYPIALNRSYHVKIEVIDNIARCYVDNILVLENVDTDIPTGTIAIILWEDDGKTNIEGEVSNNIVYALSI